MIKNKKRIADFICESFLTTDRWKNRTDLFDYDSFIVSNEEFLPEDIETTQTLKQRSTFYKGANEALDIILKVASLSDDDVICVRPVWGHENYYIWKDRKKYEIFRRLKNVLRNKESAIVDVNKDLVFLGDIVVGNFKYISKIGLFLKNTNAFVFPTHNMELIVFSDSLEITKELFDGVIVETSWKIFKDV